MTSDAQIERMEKELSKLRAGMTESVQMMEQREINTNLEYVFPPTIPPRSFLRKYVNLICLRD